MIRGAALILALGMCAWSLPDLAEAEMYPQVDETGELRIASAATDERGSGTLGAQGQAGGHNQQMTGILATALNTIRQNHGMQPLSAAQNRELEEFVGGWITLFLLGCVALTIAAVGVGMHGFANGHPRWAIANLALVIPAPIYVLLHLGNSNAPLKFLVFVAVVGSAGVVAQTSWDLYVTLERLLVSPGGI